MSLARLPKLSIAACAALPLCAVIVVRTLAPGAGPAAASAAAPVQAPASPAPPAVREPDGPPELLLAVRTLLDAPPGPTVVAAPRDHVEVKPTAPVRPAARARPSFALTSIARGGAQNIAVIDGKLRRAGDDLGEGWSVGAIDSSTGEVRLSGPDGETLTLSIRKER